MQGRPRRRAGRGICGECVVSCGFEEPIIGSRGKGCNERRRFATRKEKESSGVYFVGQSKVMEREEVQVETVIPERKRKGWKVQGIRRSNPNKKNGPNPKEVQEADWARVLDGASLGIPFERLCHLAGMSEKTFAKYLLRHPDRKEAIDAAKTRGEYDLTSVVRNCGPGWQGSAWLLERTMATLQGLN